MSRFFRQEFPSDIIARFAMAVGFPEAQGIGRTARWMYFMMASAILSEEVHDVQKRSFRTLAIEIACMFSPHVLERLHDTAIAIRINDDLFSFLIFWRVDRDAYGNAILVRDGPPAPARNALSENGSAYLKEDFDYYKEHLGLELCLVLVTCAHPIARGCQRRDGCQRRGRQRRGWQRGGYVVS